jgi:serine/threonine protein kinase, bacterial
MTDPQWQFGQGHEVLGGCPAGVSGTVWLIREQESGTERAVKVLRPELTASGQAVDGLRALLTRVGRLAHPGILAVDDVVAHEGRLALVMRRIPGEDLRGLLTREAALAPAIAVGLVAQLCDALAVAHAAGIAHGDLKPSNVLLDWEPPTGRAPAVRLTDFGMAALVAGAAAQPGAMTASATAPGAAIVSFTAPGPVLVPALAPVPASALPAEYRAPEIWPAGPSGRSMKPTAAADVYAIGVMLYEALTGNPPFTGSNPGVIGRLHRGAQPARIPALPDPLWLLVAACLDKHPQHRPTAANLATLLREVGPMVEMLLASATQDTVQMSRIAITATPVPAVLTAAELAALSEPESRPLTRPSRPRPLDTDEPDQPARRGLRKVELAALSGTVLIAAVLTYVLTSGSSSPEHLTAGSAAVPTNAATTMAGNSLSTMTTTLPLSTSSSGQASSTATATAGSSTSTQPTPSASTTRATPTPLISTGSSSPSPTSSPTPTKTATAPPPITVNWQCATSEVNNDLSKSSCIGLGSNDQLYLKGTFSTSNNQVITNIRLTLIDGNQLLDSTSENCGATTCTFSTGPYDPPAGIYLVFAGIDNSSHNEDSPSLTFSPA